MRQPFDEIGAPVPFGGALAVPRSLAVGKVQQRPEVHERTHRQHEHARIGLIGDWHGRDAHVVGIERVNVVGRRYMAEDKGHGRIEIAPARRDAVPHYAMVIGTRVIADAVLFVRCDVGRIERTERRRYRQTVGPCGIEWQPKQSPAKASSRPRGIRACIRSGERACRACGATLDVRNRPDKTTSAATTPMTTIATIQLRIIVFFIANPPSRSHSRAWRGRHRARLRNTARTPYSGKYDH